MREKFGVDTILSLKERAGSICSFPSCGASTSGPSLESSTKTTNTGVAAHICAASQGKGARRRLDLSKFDRNLLSDFSNGIWMCGTHAKLIDTDEHRFTVPMLKRWRELAELRAMLEQELTGKSVKLHLRDGNEIPLAEVDLLLNRFEDDARDNMCASVLDSCIVDVWGKDIGLAVRDLVAELMENAFKHGKASQFKLNIHLNQIVIKSDDPPYSFGDLLDDINRSGGQRAATSLLRFNDRLITSYRREGIFNVLEIAFITSSEQVLRTTACSIDYGQFRMALQDEEPLPRLYSNCETIYVVMGPNRHLIPSVALKLKPRLIKLADANKRIVLIGSAISEDVVILLKDDFPDMQVIQL